MAPHEITMSEMIDTTNEAEITFVYMYMDFLIWLWNMRITFPFLEILLTTIDISSCFRFPYFFADVIGAFGFVIGPWFFVASYYSSCLVLFWETASNQKSREAFGHD